MMTVESEEIRERLRLTFGLKELMGWSTKKKRLREN